MRTARVRLAFSVLIVIAMVSSGLSVTSFVSNKDATPAVSGPAGDSGTRTDQTTTVSTLGVLDTNAVQEDNLPLATTDNQPYDEQEAEGRDVLVEGQNGQGSTGNIGNGIKARVVQTDDTGTRSPGIDAGGPYGGPTCFEGSCTIHFEITTDDPTLIFFRWDWNNDGIADTPWLTQMTYDKTYNDNYYANVRAEGWDGISKIPVTIYGNTWGESGAYTYGFAYGNIGWRFLAKQDMDATRLGFFYYIYAFTTPWSLRIWDYATQTQLGTCTPSSMPTQYAWYWCTLPAAVSLIGGKEYMVSGHKNSDASATGYWNAYNNLAVSFEKVSFMGMYYATGTPQRFPNVLYNSGTTYEPMIDFEWRQTTMKELTYGDIAFVDVSNVSPQTYDIVQNPIPGLEGSPVMVSATFDDPGSADTWQYRWQLPSGTYTAWNPVKKYSGGANVLLYHTATGVDTYINAFRAGIIAQCGAFCIKVDSYNFGTTPMTLSQLMAYDVVWVDTYSGTTPAGTGDLLADYMDAKGSQGSGGVIVNGRGPYNTGAWQILGRYFTDQYSPVPYGVSQWLYKNIGTIYVPGHPILDGVTQVSAYPHSQIFSTNPGATRIVDWTDGAVMLATKENPKVSNGARAVAMPWRSWTSADGTCNGDCIRMVANAIRWVSRQPDPVPLSMPISLPWNQLTFKDDDPMTTSPQDYMSVKVQVKDDDYQGSEGISTDALFQDFQKGTCTITQFPGGWTKAPTGTTGWRCQTITVWTSLGAYNSYSYSTYGTWSYLYSPTFSMTGVSYNNASIRWRNYWVANYAGGTQDGFIELSSDGGATYPYILAEFHHLNPATEDKYYELSLMGYPLTSTMKLRFRFYNNNDWYWGIDDVKVTLRSLRFIDTGLGEVMGMILVQNVPPAIIGGPTSVLRDESQSVLFSGWELSDPALMQPTEWFAYKLDFDDGTPAEWVYKGTLSPGKQDILFIHHACTTGNTCASYTIIANMLLSMDLVGSVTGYNWFEALSAPTLAYMLQFDVILYGGEWASQGSPAFDAAKLLVGNRLADYLDAHGGGVVTFMATYDLSSTYGELFSLTGRYMDQDYGPFEKAVYPFANAALGTIHYPNHPVMKGVADVTSGTIHSGNLATTAGGLRLASWNDGGAAVGVNEKDGNKRSCAINAYTAAYGGADASKLLRNCIGWVIGGIPSAEIPAVTHVWGDNGLYTVDVTVIDDDMGWTWDAVGNAPVADPTYTQTLAHRYIPISVNNVDPTIQSAAAYTNAKLCLRMSGNKGNDATLTVMGTDGSYSKVTTTREPGKPAVGCLPTLRIEMTPDTKYTLTIAYDPRGDGGANPTWIFESTWPGGKMKELRYAFNSNDGPSVATIGNKEFKRLAIGSPLTFEAVATDPGSDDLVFAWAWSDLTPYNLHIYAHPGIFYTSATSDDFNLLPFKEPKFIFADNSVRSPEYNPITAHDTATHTFDESQMPYFLYVTLIVADDDSGNPYSSPYLWPGMDVEIVRIDL